jgi:hypothetical protein
VKPIIVHERPERLVPVQVGPADVRGRNPHERVGVGLDRRSWDLTHRHDESESGQQELYVALRGSGSLDIEGISLPLDAEHLVKVDAGTAWVLSSGPDGLRVLCIGGVPGGVYEPPEWSSDGE